MEQLCGGRQGNRVKTKGATPSREDAKKNRQDAELNTDWRFGWLIVPGSGPRCECKHSVLAVLGRPGALALNFCSFTRLPCGGRRVCWQSAPVWSSVTVMPDGLYERDILSWSEHQADLLRRLARGERVNDVDWTHVVEEIEDVGLSELHAVESYLDLILVHLLKVHGWPNSLSIRHWRTEIASFQKNAVRRFSPSMRQRIDLAKLYSDALEQLEG
jgi:Domain of unknown function DUF29